MRNVEGLNLLASSLLLLMAPYIHGGDPAGVFIG